MNAIVLAAGAIVRLWTRLYTAGLPALTREIRRDEIASDLWESTHDPARAPLGALHVVGRLLMGVPDDLRWRAARTSPRVLATIGASIGAGILVTWVYLTFLGPQRLPRPHGQPMHFVSDRPQLAPPPLPPPPPPSPR